MNTITLPRATVEQALEALLKSHTCPLLPDDCEEAITSLRAALAQQTEPNAEYERGFIDGMQKQAQSSVDRAVNRMAEPERHFCERCGKRLSQDGIHTCTPPQQAEPVVGVVWGVDWGRDGDRACASIVKKRADGSVEIVAVEYAPYTAPPQRKPLTDEQLLYIYNQLPNWGMDMDRLPQGLEKFARAVERAHGITDPQVKDHLARHGIPKP